MAGEHTRGGGCGLIGLNAENLTRGDSRVKVRLESVPDKLRSGAWPSSVRVVRCPVKSGNEQDPCPMLQLCISVCRHSWGTAADKAEEGAVDGRSVCSESSGLHAAYNDWDNGMRHRKVKLIPKPSLSSDRGLQPALVKPKSLVVAGHHPAANMFLLLAHTARQANRVGNSRAPGSCQDRVRAL